MRTLSLAIVFAATAFASSASFAQAAPSEAARTPAPPSLVTPFAVDVQGKPVARTWMGVDDFKPYVGVYAMADGRILRVSRQQNRFFAQFNDDAPVRIYAVNSKDFIGANGDLSLKFDHEDGNLRHDVLAFVPSTGITVASR